MCAKMCRLIVMSLIMFLMVVRNVSPIFYDLCSYRRWAAGNLWGMLKRKVSHA